MVVVVRWRVCEECRCVCRCRCRPFFFAVSFCFLSVSRPLFHSLTHSCYSYSNSSGGALLMRRASFSPPLFFDSFPVPLYFLFSLSLLHFKMSFAFWSLCTHQAVPAAYIFFSPLAGLPFPLPLKPVAILLTAQRLGALLQAMRIRKSTSPVLGRDSSTNEKKIGRERSTNVKPEDH